jgi:hypothetical protein
MKRYDCLRAIAPHFGEELVVTNIGAVRHEWQALRPHPGNYHLQNLGLTSSMALGLALALPHPRLWLSTGTALCSSISAAWPQWQTNIRRT